jgi:membrane-associated phospholipid phosphatase
VFFTSLFEISGDTVPDYKTPAAAPSNDTVRRLIVAAGFVALLALVAVLAPVRGNLFLPPGLLPRPELAGGVRLDEVLFGVGTSFGDGTGLVLLTGVVIAGLLATRRSRDALFVGICVVSASVVVRLAKDVFDAPRPDTVGIYSALVPDIPRMVVVVIALAISIGGQLTRWRVLSFVIGASLLALLAGQMLGARLVPVIRGHDSFPSGHAMNSMALAFAVVLITLRRWPADRWAVVVATTYAVVIGISRVYLGTHYVSEVLAGWALATAWVFCCWLVRRELDASASESFATELRRAATGDPGLPRPRAMGRSRGRGQNGLFGR